MAEQLAMVVADGVLEPRGPVWRWRLMDANHWCAYPDRLVAVADLDDEHLASVLAYLATWSEVRVRKLIDAWWKWYPHGEPAGEVASDLESHEVEMLCELDDRRWLEHHIVPCLANLEGEARRRGIPVPRIPSYLTPPDPFAPTEASSDHCLSPTTRYDKPQANPANPKPKPHRPKPRRCGVCGVLGHDARVCKARRG